MGPGDGVTGPKIAVIENIDVVEVEYNTEEIMIDISYLVRLKAFFYFWIQFDHCNVISSHTMQYIIYCRKLPLHLLII